MHTLYKKVNVFFFSPNLSTQSRLCMSVQTLKPADSNSYSYYI